MRPCSPSKSACCSCSARRPHSGWERRSLSRAGALPRRPLGGWSYNRRRRSLHQSVARLRPRKLRAEGSGTGVIRSGRPTGLGYDSFSWWTDGFCLLRYAALTVHFVAPKPMTSPNKVNGNSDKWHPYYYAHLFTTRILTRPDGTRAGGTPSSCRRRGCNF